MAECEQSLVVINAEKKKPEKILHTTTTTMKNTTERTEVQQKPQRNLKFTEGFICLITFILVASAH